MKNLVWRVCKGCIPTRARLLDKGVNCSSCVMCEESYDDVSHVLFDCPRATKVWQDSLLLSKVNSVMLRNNTAAEFIFALLQELSHDQAELFAPVLWSLWKSRNLRLWQNVTETSQAILERAKQLLANWRIANRKRQQGGGTAMSTDSNTALQCTGSAELLAETSQW